jgi:uncharacterized membrane protein (DUF106 family)
MSRTERKVRDLVEDDPAMEDAIAVVKRKAADNGDGVAWGDVSDDITSGQWGRMIETGIVVDNENGGFRLRDPEEVEEALSEDSKAVAEATADDDEIEPQGWSMWDKLAGVGVLAVMAGYYYTPIQDAVGGTLGAVLGPLDQVLPFYALIIVLASLTGVYSTVLMSNLMNTELMAKQQEKVKAVRERKEKAKERGDDAALEKIREEEMDMMSDQMGMFKEQFRPMVWVTLITIPVFLWLWYTIGRGAAAGAGVAGPEHLVGGEPGAVLPFVGEVAWNAGVLGPMQAWIVFYFLCSMAFTQLIRKAVNIQTTPTT